MPAYSLTQRRQLQVDGMTLLDAVSETLELSADPTETGVFLTAEPNESDADHQIRLGHWQHVEQFVAAYRPDPWWMLPKTGTDIRDVLPETQYLLTQLQGPLYCLYLPLIDSTFRSSLQGTPEDGLKIHSESGDPDCVCRSFTCLYLAVDSDPYELMRKAATAVCDRLQTVAQRQNQPAPKILNLFGWCTWDAFYCNVSHDKVIAGLRSFSEAGVCPRFLVLDDGWLSVTESELGCKRLTDFAANEKFPGNLQATVHAAKETFGIEMFYVWHALQGYWDGIDPSRLSTYQAADTPRTYSEGILHHAPEMCDAKPCTLVPASHIKDFFRDFHQHLKQQGVDGVKVDNQSTLEALGAGRGGRVRLMRAYREALEDSVATHFEGELINCMSCSNDAVYNTRRSSITRSSTDFQPRTPESHGRHIAANAVNSYFLGEFVLPDWDMFQSGHVAGAYHAAARAISGGPVYVSDEPGKQDPKVLRKLVLSTGRVLCPTQPARPSRDCLFADCGHDDVLLKIFTTNRFGGVVGTFNCQFHEDEQKRHFIAGGVRPADVEGLAGIDFALYSHQGGKLSRGQRASRMAVWLTELGFEIVTIMPIQDGFAPIGLIDKYNSGGAIRDLTYQHGLCSVELFDGGTFLAWAEDEPARLQMNGRNLPFSFNPRDHALQAELPTGQTLRLDIHLGTGPKQERPVRASEPALAHLAANSNRRLLFRIPNNDPNA